MFCMFNASLDPKGVEEGSYYSTDDADAERGIKVRNYSRLDALLCRKPVVPTGSTPHSASRISDAEVDFGSVYPSK